MIKVGCCGFPTSMTRYFQHYGLVELNSTFYQYPQLKTVEGWRGKAPENFEFTVKAHQDISHKSKLKTDEVCIHAFEYMKKICSALKSKIMLIQTPGSFRPERLGDAEKFFKSLNREKLFLVWETRGPEWEKPEVYERLSSVLRSLNVIHVTDPFKMKPAYTGDIAYFRLHGLGEELYYYQFTDAELRNLAEIIKPFESGKRVVYVLFNNLSMFEDGQRFAEYLAKGVFPKITGSVGLDSIKSVVEKTRYPVSKSALVRKVGWRIVEISEGKQVKLAELLESLSSKIFKSSEELLTQLKDAYKL
ncbi:MAG: DUF72 domain-containing protein [Candidatus Bathyarchaeia archaeon]